MGNDFDKRSAIDLVDKVNINDGVIKMKEEIYLEKLREKLTSATFNKETKKRGWFSLPIVSIIVLTLIFISIVLFINTNTDSQLIPSDRNHQIAHSLSKRTIPLSQSEKNNKYNVQRTINNEKKLINKSKDDNRNANRTVYTIQTGSFSNATDAQKQFNFILQRLNKNELEHLRIEKVDKYYSVRLGKFKDYTNAEKFHKTITLKLSEAIIMKAYMKDERIIRLYKDSISSDSLALNAFNQ